MIEISPAEYDCLLSGVPETSPVYSALRDGIKRDGGESNVESEKMAILCEPSQAMTILQAAKKLRPDIAYAVAKGIRLFRPA